MNPFRKELAYTLVIMLGSMTFGLSMGFWSPSHEELCIDLDFKNKTEENLFNPLAPFGCIFGGPLINILVSKLGRRIPMFITAVIAAISYYILANVHRSFSWLALVARFITGLTVGSFSTICPLYITELAPTELRAGYGTLNQLGVGLGSTLTYLLGYFTGWRNIAYVAAVPSSLLCLLIWLIPESPAVDRIKQQNAAGTPATSIFQKKFIKPLIISVLLMFFQQFSGTCTFLANLKEVFEDCGAPLSPDLASFVVGITGNAFCLIAAPIINKLGRKPSWFVSCLGQAIVLAIGAMNQKYNWSKWIPLICIFLDNSLFSLGLAPIPWFVVPEMFPDAVRSLMSSLMTSVNWIFSTVAFYTWPYMKDEEHGIGMVFSFVFFAIICFLAVFFGIFIMQETKGEMGGEDVEPNDKPLLTSE